MGCRCNERRVAIRNTVNSLARGNVAAAASNAGFVATSFVADARSGALKRAAADRLAQLRPRVRR